MNEQCEYRTQNGKCGIVDSYYGRKQCEPITLADFDSILNCVDTVDLKDACKRKSTYGNYFRYIEEDQIEDLRDGKIVCCGVGEYEVFIALKKKGDLEND